jgi:hypothetical protein
VQEDGGGNDDAGLKAAAGTEIAVELHIKAENEDERQNKFRRNPQDRIKTHA